MDRLVSCVTTGYVAASLDWTACQRRSAPSRRRGSARRAVASLDKKSFPGSRASRAATVARTSCASSLRTTPRRLAAEARPRRIILNFQHSQTNKFQNPANNETEKPKPSPALTKWGGPDAAYPLGGPLPNRKPPANRKAALEADNQTSRAGAAAATPLAGPRCPSPLSTISAHVKSRPTKAPIPSVGRLVARRAPRQQPPARVSERVLLQVAGLRGVASSLADCRGRARSHARVESELPSAAST
jgi:hypothetical protein